MIVLLCEGREQFLHVDQKVAARISAVSDQSSHDVLKRADQGIYAAKTGGRNRVALM